METALQLSFRRCVAKLARHQWDGGCRVKRLKGVPFPIWEARTDAGNRVVFTLAATDGGGAQEVRIWDLLQHDDVPRVARRLVPLDLQFLADLDTPSEFEEVSDENRDGLVRLPWSIRPRSLPS